MAVVDHGAATPSIYHVHTDHLERPIRMTDAFQNVVWDAVYLPFGGIHSLTGSATLNLGFPGQWFQLETGLHYNWHRHYDPTTGRYIQADPLGMPDGPSRFAYVANSPLMYTDPTGEQSIRRRLLTPPVGGPNQQAPNISLPSVPPIITLPNPFGEPIVLPGPGLMLEICRILLTPSFNQSADDPLGDLTPEEVDAIQDAVDEVGRPLDVVGSAAKGKRGPDSDIDFTTGPASLPNFEGSNLPGLDDHGILSGSPDAGKPSIRFEPGRKPRFIPGN